MDSTITKTVSNIHLGVYLIIMQRFSQIAEVEMMLIYLS